MGSKRGTGSTLGGFDGELNSIVKEYLEFCGFNKTLTSFEAEARDKGKPVVALPPRSWDKNKNDLQIDLLAFFKAGIGTEFFKIWVESIPEGVRNNEHICKKLEFYLNIYFAIYPIKYQMSTGKRSKIKLEDSMGTFRTYLETRGATLSQTTEFLPFYALPFVPDPTKHPSYKELFMDNWVPDLKLRLEKFLALALPAQAQPRLFEIYQDINNKNSGQMQRLQQSVVDAERRTMTYIKRYNKIQADYHNLIGITAELVDTLESCISGKQVTPEYLQMVCQRLFSNQLHESVDVIRPATAGSLLKASFAQHSPIPEERHDDVPLLPSLDYDKVKHDLLNTSIRLRALLLQALRWRLTRSEPGDQRDTVMMAYVDHDVLGCMEDTPHRRAVLDMLVDPDDVIQQYSCRLFNAFASLSVGRTYLGKNPDLVPSLQKTLTSEEKDPITRENALGTLQKLSLKRHLQTTMIEGGIITWLVQILEDSDSLSDYTLEYSIALLMNLCLRTSGKRKCISEKGKILKVLSDLLGHEDQEIRPYVNGTLYSILSVPEIREEARAIGMEEILKCFIKEDTPEMNRQLQFIIKQLNSDLAMDDAESDDEEEEEDEDQDQDAMEADLDKAEAIKAKPGEVTGEKLLTTEYLGSLSRSTSASRKQQGDAVESHAYEANIGNQEIGHPSVQSGSRARRREQQSRDGEGNRTQSATSRNNEIENIPQENAMEKQSDKPMDERRLSRNPTARHDDFTTAFGSRPKIPRTPDGASRAASRGITSPLPPPRSASPSRSRPGTGQMRESAGSRRERSSANSRSGPVQEN